jgi:hypothetical protein
MRFTVRDRRVIFQPLTRGLALAMSSDEGLRIREKRASDELEDKDRQTRQIRLYYRDKARVTS